MYKEEIKIIEAVINEAHFNLGKFADNKEHKLQIQLRTNFRLPVDVDSFTVLLNIVLKVSIPKNTDFSILLDTDFIFSFEERPEDYDLFVEEKCIPVARIELYNKLDDILNTMGYPKFELNKKLEEQGA